MADQTNTSSMSTIISEPDFNKEVAWGSKRDLFNRYFLNTIQANMHTYASIDIVESVSFEQNIKKMREYYGK